MNIEEFKKIMISYAEKINIKFTEEQLEKFYQYMNMLLEWNEKINLTAIVEPKEVILKHFIDSLTINKYLKENATLADVGTGAGFPGIPLKILRPDIKVTLVDSLNKRINFLNEVIEKLNLEDIVTVHSRIEDFGKNKSYREKFDYVTSGKNAINVLGGKIEKVDEFVLPDSDISRNVIILSKIKNTPAIFPRKAGMPSKEPLK